METKKKSCSCRCKSKAEKNDEQKYSGLAVNEADGNKVNKDMVKERTETLNNNPRNNE